MYIALSDTDILPLYYMKRYGYIFDVPTDEGLSEIRSRMKGYGLAHLYSDRTCDEVSRPQWHNMLDRIAAGDEIVLARISNAVRGLSELSALFELCQLLSVRIVSFGDGYDSFGELFPDQSADRMESVLAQLPKEIAGIRNIRSSEQVPKRPMRNSLETQQLHQTVINMYVSGTPLENIMRATGFATKKSIFDVLKRYNVPRRTAQRNREPKPAVSSSTVSDRHAQVIAQYKHGSPVKDIAHKCGYSTLQVYRILKEHGIAADRNSSHKRHDLVISLYESGQTIEETAQATGYTRQTVYAIVKERGIIRSGEPWRKDKD